MQTHYFPKWLALGAKNKNTRVYWALEPSGDALLFVHGFGGDAVKTWLQFPTLLQSLPGLAGYDLIFYGYDSVNMRVVPSAGLLRQALDKLMTSPAEVANGTFSDEEIERPQDFAYRSLVVVAHSLGAVVSRQALLDAQRLRSDWVRRAGLILFAPAHKGAAVHKLIPEGFGIPLAMALLGNLGIPTPQSLKDLVPTSRTLQKLERQTQDEVTLRDARYLVARKVVFGDHDTIVDPDGFGDDPPPDILLGRYHSDVCKPKANFQDPVSLVMSVLD